jgi:hypothetical protein
MLVIWQLPNLDDLGAANSRPHCSELLYSTLSACRDLNTKSGGEINPDLRDRVMYPKILEPE